ncbi:MAG: Uma2 family endonuclease [Lachnospiraceae bacterium]|nr:Uma2 family endonuclease [Lachnospiraceae bacterium]
MSEQINQEYQKEKNENETFLRKSRENAAAYEWQPDTADEDQVRESSAEYAYHRQGEYTLDDYYALPDDRRAELIDGVIYDMAAPALDHQTMVFQIVRQLDEYIDAHGGSCVPFASPVDVQLDCDDQTMVQPDVVLLCDRKKAAGRCIYGAPDLVMEILSSSTSRRDQTLKLNKYRDAGVREYWIIDLKQKRVIVHDFEHKSHPAIYGMDVPIPVRIYDGKCQIRFDRFFARMEMLNSGGEAGGQKEKDIG